MVPRHGLLAPEGRLVPWIQQTAAPARVDHAWVLYQPIGRAGRHDRGSEGWPHWRSGAARRTPSGRGRDLPPARSRGASARPAAAAPATAAAAAGASASASAAAPVAATAPEEPAPGPDEARSPSPSPAQAAAVNAPRRKSKSKSPAPSQASRANSPKPRNQGHWALGRDQSTDSASDRAAPGGARQPQATAAPPTQLPAPGAGAATESPLSGDNSFATLASKSAKKATRSQRCPARSLMRRTPPGRAS